MKTSSIRPVAVSRKGLVCQAGASRVTQSKKDIIVSPSILSADFARLGDEVRRGGLHVVLILQKVSEISSVLSDCATSTISLSYSPVSGHHFFTTAYFSSFAQIKAIGEDEMMLLIFFHGSRFGIQSSQ